MRQTRGAKYDNKIKKVFVIFAVLNLSLYIDSHNGVTQCG